MVTSILNLAELNESLLEQMQQLTQRADEGDNNVAKSSTSLRIVPNGKTNIVESIFGFCRRVTYSLRRWSGRKE